ncbi:fimbrial protein SteF [Cedecea davisae]|uniref:Fimbrial protein n=1 Tax=Cedecea davisae DSM 4568 TaxID=566551 RepID=S3IXT0_9ENTR|nr:fimbrial protein [Cedecea davisae]EPF17725.1 fimbrial protein [Cedecea davisae DSM 4568]SUX28052.1 fimbrial protein SteF [Cedecea davisae]
MNGQKYLSCTLKQARCAVAAVKNGSLCFFLLAMAITNTALAADNVEIKGELVTEPCSLSPESELIPLDFKNVVSKYLYINGRTLGMPFIIKLVDCDTSLGNTAMVAFTGSEGVLPGLMVPDDGDTHGIAFGIETREGQPVPFNKLSPVFELSDGETEMNLQGYIQAEPDALKNESVLLGPFIGTATFEINYP